MDNLTIQAQGIYLGYNSINGIGEYYARIFLRRADGSIVDGKVPINLYYGLIRGNEYDLLLIRANDPALARRTWV